MNLTDQVYCDLQRVCSAFCVEGEFAGYEQIKVGNINRTYKVRYVKPDGAEKDYVVQRVNTYVFKRPEQVMENIDRVTGHLREKTPGRVSLHFYHTQDRKNYVSDESGFWRLFNYIPSSTYNSVEDLNIVRNAGEAFGEFQMMLADFDAASLHETIEGFHNTRMRVENLERDMAKDPCGRCAEVKEELDWLIAHKEIGCKLTHMYENGLLPARVTHNDTKINNVLFEKDGTQPLVVIDLDTVMPGLVGHDFGDAIRSAGNFVEEDCPDYEKAGVNIPVFRAFAEGFLSRTAKVLTQNEIDTLALSAFVLAYEQAVRFVNDYILGDPYYKINYPEHNLVRTRCQVALAKDLLKHQDALQAIVNECCENYR